MKIKKDSLRTDWERNIRFSWTGEKWVVDVDERIPRMLVSLDRLTFELARSNDRLFAPMALGQDNIGNAGTKFGRELTEMLRTFDPFLVRQYFTSHLMSPYFELWEDHWDEVCSFLTLGTDPACVAAANAFVEKIRAIARRDDFTKMLRNHRRVASKNWQGFKKYIDSLFEKHSRLLVVRVDLGYHYNPVEPVGARSHVSEEEFRSHLRQMLKYVRKHVPDLVGSAWKVEYGAGKGWHAHLLAIQLGHRHRQGITWGKLLCEKWEQVTGGLGTAWNCNADEDKYRRRGLLGIGLIDHTDTDLRAGLVRTAMYLVKVDAYAKLKTKSGARNFGRGDQLPTAEGKRVGRPRKKAEV